VNKKMLVSENVTLVHPWENSEALGATTGQLFKNTYSGCFLVVAHKTDHVKSDDCVEHEALWLQETDKLSIVVLSETPWKPTWRKVSSRNATVYNNLVVGQDDKYYSVLFNCDGSLQKLWLSERVLEKFTWGETDIEKIWQTEPPLANF